MRSLSAAFHTGDGPPPLVAAVAAAAAPAGSDPSSAWSGDDPVSRAVRAGCDVVEKAVRRGFGFGRDPASTPSWGPWTGGPLAGPWTTGQWVDAMTSATAQWTQWVDAWSAMARSMMYGAEPVQGARPPAQAPSPAPSSSQPHAAALHVTVELRTARAASVQLDLTGDPPPGAALEIHGLLAPPAAAAPPITDVTVAVADGGVRVALGSVDHHPAGTYAGAVLAAGRACGTLTVRLT